MTREQALQIKEWRLHYNGEGCSWRVLAALAYDAWKDNLPATKTFPETSIYCSGHQLYGRDLHNMACEVLNEQFDVDEKS